MKLSAILLLSLTIFARPLPFETTRLKSTGGTGVASILMDEASFVNPAPLAFFNISSLYFEKNQSSTEINNRVQKKKNLIFIASDSSSRLKSSFAYIKSNNLSEKRKQINIATAIPLSEKSSIGISYQHIKQSFLYNNISISEKYSQLNIGVLHAISESFTLGLLAVDPMKKAVNQTRAIIGVQYRFAHFLTFLLDLGANYNRPLHKTVLYRVAIQSKVLGTFYTRFGIFEDKQHQRRGSGFGIGWVQPKLVINFAIKNTNQSELKEFQQYKAKLRETSISLAYQF